MMDKSHLLSHYIPQRCHLQGNDYPTIWIIAMLEAAYSRLTIIFIEVKWEVEEGWPEFLFMTYIFQLSL